MSKEASWQFRTSGLSPSCSSSEAAHGCVSGEHMWSWNPHPCPAVTMGTPLQHPLRPVGSLDFHLLAVGRWCQGSVRESQLKQKFFCFCLFRTARGGGGGHVEIPRLRVPIVVQGKLIQQVSMRLQVRSLVLLSGLRIQRCRELWSRSQTWLGSGMAVAVA